MEIVSKRIEDIVPYENNPRKNDNAVDYVANSIKEFGFKVPIVIDKDNVVIAGHTRLKASEKLGLKEVPCVIADDLTDDQIKAFRIADNKVSEFSMWDMEKLSMELEEIELDMADFGIGDIDDTEIADVESEEQESKNPYSGKAKIPQYEIVGEEPTLDKLVDTKWADELAEEIDRAEIPKDIKGFLKLATTRHYVFDYKNIAEYYAHADKDVQKLMERSALVIIDINDAMANGYAQLREDLIAMGEEEDEE